MKYSLPQLLKTLVDQGASDMHLSANSRPRLRIDGSLIPLQVDPLQPDEVRELCYSILTERQKQKLESTREVDLAFELGDVARFRANVFFQKQTVSGAFRIIPTKIKALHELGLPTIIKEICTLTKGLVLVTGPTGSGKSTTLAAMIDHINRSRFDHIVTIEDPIEFVHPHQQCVINQRELGIDTHSFSAALKSALRQDPDIVMVGEMRDLETISAALTAAETGHLVLATLHTNSCISTLNRIIDMYPPHQQAQIQTQLSMTLAAVLSQGLIPLEKGGRTLALEVMRSNTAISAHIRDGQFKQMYSAMQSGQADSGMRTMNQSLYSLLHKRQISISNAMRAAADVSELEKMIFEGRGSASQFIFGSYVRKRAG